jgi:FkbM family methyltransferase
MLYFKKISGTDSFVFFFSPVQLANAMPTEGYYSQRGQDWFVATRLYPDEKQGFFVDIGANHPTFISNSLWFEKQGWTGLAFEPQSKLCSLWKETRNTPCFPWAIGPEESEISFSCVNTDEWQHALASVSALERDDKAWYGGAAIERVLVRQRRLDNILQELYPPQIYMCASLMLKAMKCKYCRA